MDLTNITADDFESTAFELMNNYVLKAGEIEFIICEIEFYLKSDEHPDIYVHCDPDQLSVGKWYFHKKGGTYRGGTFKGIDISFGEGVHGGILIRAMQQCDGPFIEGPCNCVHAIMRATGHQTVAALAGAIGADHTVFANDVLRLMQCPARDDVVYMSKRVGLNPAKSVHYAEAPYRYITLVDRVKKRRADIIAGLREFHGFDDSEIKEVLKK